MATGYREPGTGYRSPGLGYRGGAAGPPPPIPPSPGEIVPLPPEHPLYRVVITDRTGFALAELSVRNLQFSYVLNAPGAVSFTMPVHEVTRDILSPGEREVH